MNPAMPYHPSILGFTVAWRAQKRTDAASVPFMFLIVTGERSMPLWIGKRIDGRVMRMKKYGFAPYDGYGLSTFAECGGTVHTGHFGGSRDADGNIIPTIEGQMARTLDTLAANLEKIGYGLADVVKVTVILRNIADFRAMHEVWKRYFPAEPPARTTVTSDFVDAHCLVHIDAVAYRDPVG